MIKQLAALVFSVGLMANVSANDTKPSFDQYVAIIKAQAIEKGYDKSLVDEALSNLTYRKKVVKKDRTQPEKVQTLDAYLPKRVNDWVVNKARTLYQQNHQLLNEIGEQYGVQPRFIVALWGLESAFGKYQGDHSIFASLTTLAYEGRRESFYRPQIFAALEIAKRGQSTVAQMKSSWAGAMGQSQFMPTSYLSFAVDFDGDGKKDIWNNKADVFASIANYLKSEGWNNEGTWGRQVKLPAKFDNKLAIAKGSKSLTQWLKKWRQSEKSLAQWHELGLLRFNGESLPSTKVKAALILPDDAKGRAYLAYNNYKTLMHWNRSYYFATSVGYLSDRIKYPPIDFTADNSDG